MLVPGASGMKVGQAHVFRFRRARSILEGFFLRTEDGFAAYANECPHWHVDLDLGDGVFWDDSNRRILCKNHGALFHPQTGICELGPCVGQSLEPFQIELVGENAWVTVPDATAPLSEADGTS